MAEGLTLDAGTVLSSNSWDAAGGPPVSHILPRASSDTPRLAEQNHFLLLLGPPLHRNLSTKLAKPLVVTSDLQGCAGQGGTSSYSEQGRAEDPSATLPLHISSTDPLQIGHPDTDLPGVPTAEQHGWLKFQN